MAQDIIDMLPWEAKCPCCSKPLLVKWQIATYAEGGDSYQFGGLEIDANKLADALRKKTYKPTQLERQKSLDEYYNTYPIGSKVVIRRNYVWIPAEVVARHRQSKGRTVNIEVKTDKGLRLFYSFGSRNKIEIDTAEVEVEVEK